MVLKCWKNQTSKTQKSYGGIQYIHKDNTQVSVNKWNYGPKPKNYQVTVTSKSEARKGYPNTEVGISKKEALRRMNKYMKSKDKC